MPFEEQETRVSAGEWAGLIAALAFVLLVVLIAIPLLKLGRTLDETTLTIRQVREQSAPMANRRRARRSAHVNSNLERVDDITGNAANVSSNVAALSSVVAATLGSPLIKVAAFSYGVRTAAKAKREGRAGRGRRCPGQGSPPRPSRRAEVLLMRRLFWRAMGITIGALVVRKLLRRRGEDDPPRASAHRDRRRPAGTSPTRWVTSVPTSSAAAADREAELRAGTGLDAPLPTGDQVQLPGRRGAHSA